MPLFPSLTTLQRILESKKKLKVPFLGGGHADALAGGGVESERD